MPQRLKRLLGRGSFALRLIAVYVLLLLPPLTTLAVATKLSVPLWFAVPLAVAADPVLFLLWLLKKAGFWMIARFARFLWTFKFFRRLIWTLSGIAALAVTSWNLSSADGYAWIGIACEAIGAAALAAALFLANPPERFMKRSATVYRKRDLDLAWILLWLAGIAAVDAWLSAQVDDVLWRNWSALPDWLPDVHVPLRLLPPTVFTFFAVLARPMYFRRAAPRWLWGYWRGNGERDGQTFGRKAFVRLYPFDLNVGRRLKTVSSEVDGRRTTRVALGERFVFWRMIWTGLAFGTVVTVAVLSRIGDDIRDDLPSDLTVVENWQPVVSTVVYDRNGQTMCTFALENRLYVPLTDVPRHVQDAFIAAEDKNFWEHDGIDPNGIIRALIENHGTATEIAGKKKKQGASTMTQQIIKQMVLKDASESYGRKLKEVFLAVRLERQMTQKYGRTEAKRKILEVYLNYVFLGKNAYGVQAAAQTYFGKDVKGLTLGEAAILAGLPKAPSMDSPDGHLDRARVRQRYVLGRMLETGVITSAERDLALAEPVTIIRQPHPLNVATAPYACEEVRKNIERKFGSDVVYKQGLVVHTTFDLAYQRKAQAAVRYGLLDLERRLGFAGPEGHDKEAHGRCEGPPEWVTDNAIEANARVIARATSSITLCVRGNAFKLDDDDVRRVLQWERAKPNRSLRIDDLMTIRVETRTDAKGKTARFALTARRTGGIGHPEALQAALVAIDPSSGEVRAIVGGYDWNESQYDAATQARRQTGSSIKPYVYLSALMEGETVVSDVLDAPICLSTATGMWCPSNYSGPHTTTVYYGTVDLMTALAKSLNSVSVRLLVEVGLDKVIGTMRSLGIRSPIVRVFPLAVGTPELTLLEHTEAYATILSNGQQIVPGTFIKDVSTTLRGFDGRFIPKVIYEAPARPKQQAVPSGDAYAMGHLMRGVVEFGTGTRAKRLRRPVAGKTGTTNSFHDVWFMGGTADLVVGVWVGRMTPQPIAKEATGGVVALPIWEAFMESAFPVPKGKDEAFETPPRDFPIPDDVVLILAPGHSRESGNPDRPALLPFQRGRMPEKFLSAPSADFGHGAFE